jgi:hypothetical protein
VRTSGARKRTRYSCQRCHSLELEEREAVEREQQLEAERVRLAEEARLEEERRVEALKNTFMRPHYNALSPHQQRLFRLLSEWRTFDLRAVEKLIKVDRQEAWRAVQGLLMHNMLLELVGWAMEPRPYELDTPYAARCSPDSQYECRKSAIKQMEESIQRVAELDIPSASAGEDEPAFDTPPAAEAPAAPTYEDRVRAFVEGACVVAPETSVSDIILRRAWCDYCIELPKGDSPEAFRETLDLLGYVEKDGRRRGLKVAGRAHFKDAQAAAQEVQRV